MTSVSFVSSIPGVIQKTPDGFCRLCQSRFGGNSKKCEHDCLVGLEMSACIAAEFARNIEWHIGQLLNNGCLPDGQQDDDVLPGEHWGFRARQNASALRRMADDMLEDVCRYRQAVGR